MFLTGTSDQSFPTILVGANFFNFFEISLLLSNTKALFLSGDQVTDGRPDNTLMFELKVKCIKNSQTAKDSTTDPDDLFLNHKGMFLHSHIFLTENISNFSVFERSHVDSDWRSRQPIPM